jgi:hypothetical protein
MANRLGGDLDETMRKVAKQVRETGLSVIAVGGDFSYAFTVGLYKTYQHPEIVVTAIGAEQAADLLNLLAERIRAGERFRVGQVYDGDDEMRRSTYLTVKKKRYDDYLGTALGYYRGPNFPAIQRVSADAAGLFPWEPGCDPDMKLHQKLLGTREIAH